MGLRQSLGFILGALIGGAVVYLILDSPSPIVIVAPVIAAVVYAVNEARKQKKG